jgi:hypothetical protein
MVFRSPFILRAGIVLAATCIPACGDDEPKSATCTLGSTEGCTDRKVCEAVADGVACFAPITVKGRVFDMSTDAAIAGAHIVARDANDASVSGVAISDAQGNYTLLVPVPRTADGTPDGTITYTLRADAAGYLTFPKAPRLALPLEVSNPTNGVVQSASTNIGLIARPDATGLGSISGDVLADSPGGTLIVAGGSTGLADKDGKYTVFNVPAGTGVEVTGYLAGINLVPATAAVTADKLTSGIDLAVARDSAATVSGSITIVNGGTGDTTSVILAVASTFDENVARGEAPPGLRAFPVTNAFSIPGVPDGQYVALAAFENDLFVRDPDTAIGGTSILQITVAGQDVSFTDAFKVTGAMAVVSPDGEAEVSGTPTFVWADDSGEDHYELRVFDSFGTEVWSNLAVPGVSGSTEVSVAYGGPPLTSGFIYQFRATAIKQGGTPISQTEDLRGVFVYR